MCKRRLSKRLHILQGIYSRLDTLPTEQCNKCDIKCDYYHGFIVTDVGRNVGLTSPSAAASERVGSHAKRLCSVSQKTPRFVLNNSVKSPVM